MKDTDIEIDFPNIFYRIASIGWLGFARAN
jgi:hypothetical protein